MASPFGQPASAASLFSSAPAFGAASSTPGFGAVATPTPAFGQTAGGFSFGAASTPAATTFGAPSTPAASPFGFSSFGQSTPAFGANSTPAFGASSASIFGAASTSAFGSTGGLFGTSSTPAFGASTAGSIFGAASTPAFGSTFGAASSAAPFSFGTAGAFGGTGIGALAPAAQQPMGGMFGATQLAPASYGAAVGQDAAIKEITEIKNAYTPSNPSYKFQYLFLNVVDNPQQRVKPANVDEMRWRQAMAQAGGPNNPDRLWPVLATGFKDLLSRSAAQVKAVDENQQRLKNLSDLATRLSRKHTTELKTRAADVQKRHVELSHRLLHVTRLIDALESRLAMSMGYRGDVSRQKEQNLARQVAAVEAEVLPTSAVGLQRRLEAVAAAARLRLGGPDAAAAAASTKLDERSTQQLFAVLKEHIDAVRQLQNVLKRDQMDIDIIKSQPVL